MVPQTTTLLQMLSHLALMNQLSTAAPTQQVLTQQATLTQPELMQLMREGDEWEMYIPSELGYGDSGSPPKIQGGDVLVFVMEIIKINGGKVDAITCDPKTLDGCNDKEKKYVTKAGGKFGGDAAKMEAEIKRLEGMKKSSMKPPNQLRSAVSRCVLLFARTMPSS